MNSEEIEKEVRKHNRINDLIRVCGNPESLEQEKCEECVERSKEALNLAKNQQLPEDIINYLRFKIGVRLEHLSKPHEALSYYQEIVNSKQDHSSDIWKHSLQKSAVLNMRKSNYEFATQSFEKLIHIYKQDKDTDKLAKTILNLSSVFMGQGNYEETLKLNKKAMNLFKKLKDNYWYNIALGNEANIYYHQGDFAKAIQIKLQVIKYLEENEINDHLSREYNIISVLYRKLGELNKAIDFCLKSLKMKEMLNDKRGMSFALVNLGVFYNDLNQNEKALKYYNDSLKIKREIDDKKGISVILNNIGNIYLDQNKIDKADKYYQESYRLKIQVNDKEGLLNLLKNLCYIDDNRKQYTKALDKLNQALKLALELGAEFYKNSIYQDMAAIYIKQNDFKLAEEYLKKAEKYFSQQNLKQELLENHELFSQLYEKQKKFKQSSEQLKKYLKLKEELFSEESTQKIAEIQAKYELEKKEKEAEIYRLKNIELKNKNRAIRKQKKELEDILQKLQESEIRYDFVSSELNKNIKTTLIGQSEAIKNIIELISTVARSSNTNVLITGESGTGKEIIARKIHENSARCKHNFFAVNCSAIPDSLFESQFFGHEKNAFTGADQKKIGWFEIADKSTLFLDEIGTMTWQQQAKLLRSLEERKIVRVGSHQEFPIDVRVISATNSMLLEKVKNKTFRNDLYHRLATFVIHIPPLRERKEDIPLLLDYFIELNSVTFNKQVKKIEKQIIHALQDYDFPGNIRELKNMVERAILVMSSSTLRLKDFAIPETITKETDHGMLSLEEMEKQHIIKALKAAKFNKSKTADLLKVHRKVIERRMKKFDLDKLEKEK